MRTSPIRPTLVAVAAVTLALTVAGCTDTEKSQEQSTPPASTSATDPAPSPDPRQSAYDAAAKTVATVMDEYFKTNRSQADWYAALEPYLSAEAQYLYEDSNMANIPDGNVTGAPQLVSDDASGLRYFIDTTLGQFTVILVQEGDSGGQYVVDEIKTPNSGEYD